MLERGWIPQGSGNERLETRGEGGFAREAAFSPLTFERVFNPRLPWLELGLRDAITLRLTAAVSGDFDAVPGEDQGSGKDGRFRCADGRAGSKPCVRGKRVERVLQTRWGRNPFLTLQSRRPAAP